MKTFRIEPGRGLHVGLHAGRARAPLPPNRVQASSYRVLRVALIRKSSGFNCGYWFHSEFSISEALYGVSAGQLGHDCLMAIRNEPSSRLSGYPPSADALRCRCQLHSAVTSTPHQTRRCAFCAAPPPNHGLSAPQREEGGLGPVQRDLHPSSGRGRRARRRPCLRG